MMDGNGGNPEMHSQAVSMCKSGCGFYGDPTKEGLCSVCYKEKVQCQMEDVPKTSSIASTSSSSSNITDTCNDNSDSQTSGTQNFSDNSSPSSISIDEIDTNATKSTIILPKEEAPSLPVADLDDKTSTSKTGSGECEDPAAAAAAEIKVEKEMTKKQRCHTCKKKVGLTGFQCRCNGLFCSAHRYSDTHDCQFNYKELGQEQIRKNNPVIVGQKITKI